MNSLKIGFVLDDTLDKPDGVQQYVLLLGNWLTQQGHTVHYLVGETIQSDTRTVHSLGKNVRVKFNKNTLSVPLHAKKKIIKNLLSAEGYDILHVQMPYSPFLAAKIISAAAPRTAVVGTFHILPYSAYEKLATRLLGLISRKTLRRFSAFLAVSKPAHAFAMESYRIESDILPNCVDLNWFKSRAVERPNNGRTKLVFLGRLVERKGARQLLEALAGLPNELLSKLEVHIGGKGELLAELKQYVLDTQLSSIVSFDGFIAEEEKPAYLGQADIAVFPATSGESFGIVLIEAMASGAGVTLGGNNPGYSSVLSQWPEVLFDPNNTQEFTDLLNRMIVNTPLRRRIHAQQSKEVERYDVNVVGSKLLTVYEKAIAKNNKKQHNTN